MGSVSPELSIGGALQSLGICHVVTSSRFGAALSSSFSVVCCLPCLSYLLVNKVRRDSQFNSALPLLRSICSDVLVLFLSCFLVYWGGRAFVSGGRVDTALWLDPRPPEKRLN